MEEVTTLTGPGELIDVVITERGIAINPRRLDLLEAAKGKGLPLRDIRDIQREVYQMCGGAPIPPKRGGTVIDSVWKVART